jgi:hypothetical protein
MLTPLGELVVIAHRLRIGWLTQVDPRRGATPETGLAECPRPGGILNVSPLAFLRLIVRSAGTSEGESTFSLEVFITGGIASSILLYKINGAQLRWRLGLLTCFVAVMQQRWAAMLVMLVNR